MLIPSGGGGLHRPSFWPSLVQYIDKVYENFKYI